MDMEFTDIVRTAALVLAFLLLVFSERRTWMTADMLGAVGFGAALCLFPKMMVGFMVKGELNTLHAQLIQGVGVMLACSAMVWYLTRETRDGTVPITLIMSRVFSCGILLLAQLATHWGTTRGKKDIDYNHQHICFGMVGSGLWLLGNLIHLLRSVDFSSYPQRNIRINSHLRVDAWLGMLMALVLFAFPEWVLSLLTKEPRDALHVHLVRLIGVQDLGGAVIALQAPGFLHEHDKRYYLLGRLLTNVAMLGLLLLQSVVYNSWTREHIIGLLLANAPYTLNAVLGYMADGTAPYKIKGH